MDGSSYDAANVESVRSSFGRVIPKASYSASFARHSSSSLAISSCAARLPSRLKSLSIEQWSLCLIQRSQALYCSPGPTTTLHRSYTHTSAHIHLMTHPFWKNHCAQPMRSPYLLLPTIVARPLHPWLVSLLLPHQRTPTTHTSTPYTPFIDFPAL